MCGFVDFYPNLEGAYRHSSWRGYEAPPSSFTHTHTHTHTLAFMFWNWFYENSVRSLPQRSIYTLHGLNRVFFFDGMTISWILSTLHSSLRATGKAAIYYYYYYYYYYYLSVIILIAKFLPIFHESLIYSTASPFNLCVLRNISANFGLHENKIKFGTQYDDWMSIVSIVCTYNFACVFFYTSRVIRIVW